MSSVHRKRFQKIVSAFVIYFSEEMKPYSLNGCDATTITETICRKITGVPKHFYFALILFTYCFDLAALVVTGHRFYGASLSEQGKYISFCKKSWIGPFRDVIRLYETLTMFTYYSKF